MDDHIESFIEWLGDVSYHTRRTYRSDIRQFEKWFAVTYGQPINIDYLACSGSRPTGQNGG